MKYHIRRNGHQLGPYTLSQLRALHARHLIHRSTPYWTEGMPDWQPLGPFLDTPATPAEENEEPRVLDIAELYRFQPEPPLSIWERLVIILFSLLCTIPAFLLGVYLFITTEPQKGSRLMAYAFLWLMLHWLFRKFSLPWWSDLGGHFPPQHPMRPPYRK
jgi:hypothetical protein